MPAMVKVGRQKRGFLNRPLRAILVTLVALLLSALSHAQTEAASSAANAGDLPKHESYTLLSGPRDNIAHTTFGPRIQALLAEEYDIDLQSGSFHDVLETVSGNPATAGFSPLDQFIQFRNQHSERAIGLEFYGNIPLCVFAVARHSDGEDDPGGQNTRVFQSIDLGPAGHTTDFIVAAVAPRLAERPGVSLEHRGGYRALERSASDAEHLVLMSVPPDGDSPVLSYVSDHAQLTVVPVLPELGPLNEGSLVGNGYIPTTVSLPKPGWMPGTIQYPTICTSMGIVVNGKPTSEGERLFSEALVRSIAAIETPSSHSFQDYLDELWNRAAEVSRHSVQFIKNSWENI